jgi:hypothetical protein
LYDWRGTRMSHLEKAMDSKTHKADPKYDMTELINALGKFYNEQRKVPAPSKKSPSDELYAPSKKSPSDELYD